MSSVLANSGVVTIRIVYIEYYYIKKMLAVNSI